MFMGRLSGETDSLLLNALTKSSGRDMNGQVLTLNEH
jgi:hypothetical protein